MPVTSDESKLLVIKSNESDASEKRTDVITRHRSLYSRKDFKPGDIIALFGWEVIHSKPSYLTVQIGESEHIELSPAYLECVNHSCDPNSFFDVDTKTFVAVKNIKAGEEFAFFYPSSEWDMDQAFQCNCGSAQCLGMIRGAKHLPKNVLTKYRFTKFIEGKLAADRSKGVSKSRKSPNSRVRSSSRPS